MKMITWFAFEAILVAFVLAANGEISFLAAILIISVVGMLYSIALSLKDIARMMALPEVRQQKSAEGEAQPRSQARQERENRAGRRAGEERRLDGKHTADG